MTGNHEGDSLLLTFDHLSNASFGYNASFKLDLIDHSSFYAHHVVRITPRRRLVAFGFWHDKQVVAKLFFHPVHAKHHFEKDLSGITLLHKNKISTPKLLYQGHNVDKRIHVLLFEQLVNAKNIEEIWREMQHTEDIFPILQLVIGEMAKHHALGIIQEDLHLKNFLFNPDNETIYTLDGAEITASSTLLPKKKSMSYLALLLSQLGANAKDYQEQLFKDYAKARGWSVKEPEEINGLFNLIQDCNQRRWKNFKKRIFRESSLFVRIHTNRMNGMFRRRYEGPEFNTFLSHPHSVFSQPSARLLKRDHSATVIHLKLDNREFVIKRYDKEHTWQRIFRYFRRTQAQMSWRLAQKLQLFDIGTAPPVAFLEIKTFGLARESYYVTEYIEGEHACDYFKRNLNHDEKITTMVKQMSALLKNVATINMRHCDLKITNILVNKDEVPLLIDLDSAKEKTSLKELREDKVWKDEIDRFLTNFAQHHKLREQFEMELKEG